MGVTVRGECVGDPKSIEGILFQAGALGGEVDSRAGELVGVDGEERVRSEGL